MGASPLVLATAAAYLALVLAIGAWAARRTKSARDYFIAGQRLGLVVTALATMSAAFSGFLFLGGPGLTYRLGMASFFICVPVGFTAALLCFTLGKRLRLLAEVREVYTVPDAVGCRYRSRSAAGLAAVAVVVGTITYLGAQLLALGILIDSIFPLGGLFGDRSLAAAVALGVAVILAYATLGGMMAGVYTDLLQGGLMVTAAVAVFARALETGGGLGPMMERIAASDAFGPGFLDPLGAAPATALGFFFVFGIGPLGQPQMLHKFYMLDDPRKLRWMPLALGGSQTLAILVWLGIGLAVPALVAAGELEPLADPDRAAPAFLLGFAPDVLAGLVVAGILAAIMSTADSLVNVASAALVRDLPRALGRPLARELPWARAAVPVVAVASAAVAWLYGDLIALLGTLAFGTFAAALAPALAVGLNWKRVSATAASASIATGLVVNLGLELLGRQRLVPALADLLPQGVLPAAVALAASFTVLFAVSWITGRPEGDLDDDVRAVMET